MQSCCIVQHSKQTVHRVAQNLFLQPDMPLEELLPYNLSDQDLFRGKVPQARDWLRAWSVVRNPQSWNKAAAHYKTEDYALKPQVNPRP